MQDIWNFILNDFRSVNTNVWIILGVIIVLFVLFFIYQQSQKPRTIVFDEEEIQDTFQDRQAPATNAEDPYPTQNTSSEMQAWMFIDLCSILAISPFLYLYAFRRMFRSELMYSIGASLIGAVFVYYLLVKPTLFNTKSK